MSLDCLCAGLLVADHLCAPLARLPKAGELLVSDRLVLNIGGNASNTAMDLTKLGIEAGVIGCVGQDIFGRFVCETLDAQHIRTDGVRRLPQVETAGTLIVNVAGEDRRFIHAVGANAEFTAEMISKELVRQAKVFYLGGYLLMPKLDPSALADLFRDVKEHGVITVLDVVISGPGDHWSKLAPLLPLTDHFLPNRDEAELITGLADPWEQAARFREAGAKTVVITSGGEGSILWNQGQKLQAAAYQMEVADGSGAGDAFDAGYIAGLLQGLEPAECLRWGSALGASCVRAIGTTAGVFTRPEAVEFLKTHPLTITSR